jgi:RNA polymerase sigma-70 factor (ECF subfamily)
VYLKTTNNEIAEDIVSDVFVSALDKVSSFKIDENSSVSAWFYRIAHNKIVDYYKTNRTYDNIEDYLDL